MNPVVEIVLPVFALVALGYALAVTGYLSEAVGEGLTGWVFNVGVPLLLMRAIATAEFGETSPWAYWGAYFGGFALCWVAALVLIAGIFRRDMRTATVGGLSAGFSNLVLFGIPLIERAYGQEGLQVLFLLLALHLPVLLTVATFSMEFATRRDGADGSALDAKAVALRIARNLGRNPIIIGLLVGAAWRFADPAMPAAVEAVGSEVLDLLGRATGPLALFALGMGAVKYGIRGDVFPAAGLAALALLGLPAAVYLIGTQVVTLPPLWLKVAVTAAACPTGINAFLFASYFKVAERLATTTIVIALGGSVITVPLWLAFVA